MRSWPRIAPLLCAVACGPSAPVTASGSTGDETESQGDPSAGRTSSSTSVDGVSEDSGDASTRDGASTAADTSGTSTTTGEGSTTTGDESTTTGGESSTGREDLYPEGWSVEVSPTVIDLAVNSAGVFLQEEVDVEDDGYIEAVRIHRLDLDTGGESAGFDLEVVVNDGTPPWGTSSVRMAASEAGLVLADEDAGRVQMFHPETGALVFDTVFPDASVHQVIWSADQEAIFAVIADGSNGASGLVRVVKLSPVDGAEDPGFSFPLFEENVHFAELWATSDRVWVYVFYGFFEDYLASADIDSGGGVEEFDAAPGEIWVGEVFVVGDDVFRELDHELWPIAADPDSPPLIDLGVGIEPRHKAVTDAAVFLGGPGWRIHKRSYPDWAMDPAFGQAGDLSAPPFSGGSSEILDLGAHDGAIYPLRHHTLDGVELPRHFVDRRSGENGSL